jgi:predicted Zn-dependent protease
MLVALAAIACSKVCHAHGDVHESITEISKLIASKPGDSSLLLQRVSLYSQHGEFAEALKDLDAVEKLDAANDMVTAWRANLYFKQGRPNDAKPLQESFLKKHPANLQVKFDFCQTLRQLGEMDAALGELDALISSSEIPSPDAVAMRLELCEASGENGAAKSLEWLNAFLAKHPLPVFNEAALQLEMKLQRNDEALARLDKMITASARPETIHARKAELLSTMKNIPAARLEWQAALNSIGALPEAIRMTRSVVAMQKRATDFLTQNQIP